MTKPERNHFSKNVLTASEKFQAIVKDNRLGLAAINAVTGSSYPIYRQLIWRTADSETGLLRQTARIDGDPGAGLVPRLWKRAAILAVPTQELEDLKEKEFAFPAPEPAQEAASYIPEGVLHVGTKATHGYLFERINDEESAIAMRLGKGPLEATLGVWLPDDRAFLSVNKPRVEEANIPISNLTTEYPGIVLV